MGHERVQRFPRHRVQLVVDLVDATSYRTVTMVDLSLGGARIVDRTPPRAGTQIRLRLSLPDACVAVAARVVHVVRERDRFGRPAGMGVAFDANAGVVDVLRRYLDRVARQNGDEDGASWALLPPPNVPGPVEL